MLRAESLVSGYRSMMVLDSVDLVANAGEILLIVGANGAGKSTLLRTLSGMIPARRGSIHLDGTDVTRQSVERRARAGVRYVMEGHRIFPEMTVRDNIRLGQIPVRSQGRRPLRQVLDEIHAVFPVLAEFSDKPARSLSGGQQQMLALAQAWAADPRVLMCDEPSVGLATRLLPDIMGFLRRRADEGTAVVLVEQSIDFPLAVADRVIAMRQGAVHVEGTPDSLGGRDGVADVLHGDNVG